MMSSIQELNCVAVAGLGKEAVIADGDECINERKENVRSGIGGLCYGIKQCRKCYWQFICVSLESYPKPVSM